MEPVINTDKFKADLSLILLPGLDVGIFFDELVTCFIEQSYMVVNFKYTRFNDGKNFLVDPEVYVRWEKC